LLQLINNTPFQAALAVMTDKNGAEKAVVAVKATFSLPHENQPVWLADKQIPILYCDEYWDQPGKSSIKFPVDLVLGKAGTDIGLVGHAYSSHETPVQRLQACLQVGVYKKEILIFGNRRWKKRNFLPGFEISAPEPFIKMALRLELAFGGEDQDDNKNGYDRNNPLGSGFCVSEQNIEGRSLPNLENPVELIQNWHDEPAPACFGFVSSSWLPRVRYAGTYDDQWRKQRSPLLPQDFELRFNNAAMPDLCAIPFLEGGERVGLLNLSKDIIPEFNLPNLKVKVFFKIGYEIHAQLAELQTLIFDPDENRFCMVWGSACGFGKQLSQMRYVGIKAEGALAEIGINNESIQ